MFPPGCRAEEPQRGSRHGALGEEAEGSHVRRRRRHRSVRDGRGKALGGSGVGISLRGECVDNLDKLQHGVLICPEHMDQLPQWLSRLIDQQRPNSAQWGFRKLEVHCNIVLLR
ncbi:unnamed protein product, partial [Musa acuminata var. zebrina]